MRFVEGLLTVLSTILLALLHLQYKLPCSNRNMLDPPKTCRICTLTSSSSEALEISNSIPVARYL